MGESYIYYIKNKLSDKEEEIAKVSTEEQRTALHELASSTEDWLYEDGYDADLETYKAKYDSLYEPADGTLFFRLKEAIDRPAAILAMQTKMTKVKELMEKWKVSMPQITDDERADVLAKVEKIEEWMKEMEEKQSKLEPYDTPAFNSTEVSLQSKSLYTLVTKLGKRPKPKPKKVPKNETKSDGDQNKTTTDDANAAADGTKAEGDEKSKVDEKSNEAEDKSKEVETESSTATDEDKDKKEDSTSSDAEDDSDDPEL